jgi:hypothetical protein
MRRFPTWTLTILPISLLLLGACRPKQQPDLAKEITNAVVGTLSAIPTPTLAPRVTPYPTQALAGLFCEYEFCIGHPADVPLFDARRETNAAEFSTYGGGRLAGYRDDLFIIVAWVASSGPWDPGGMMKVLQDEFGSPANGDYRIDLMGDLNVSFQPVAAPPNSVFTSGLSANWRCADRDFVWMAFSTHDGAPATLLTEALAKFRCENP